MHPAFELEESIESAKSGLTRHKTGCNLDFEVSTFLDRPAVPSKGLKTVKQPELADKTADQATQLCTNCGICCDGSIFNSARLVPEDGAVTSPLRTSSDDGDDGLYLKIPCAALDNSRKCSVYPNRPEICGSFRCALLRKLDAGTISLSSARKKVELALEQREKTLEIVRQFVAVEDRDLRAIHREYLNLGDDPESDNQRLYKEGQLLLNALRRYLRKNFHPNSRFLEKT